MTSFLASYLLNALWQAPLVLAVSWLLAFAVRRLGPRAEHRLWVVTLVAQVVLPACSLPGVAPALRGLFFTGHRQSVTVSIALGPAHPVGAVGSVPWLGVALVLYAVVTAAFLIRFAWQSMRLRTLRRTAAPALFPDQEAAFVQACTRALGLNPVRIASAPAVHTPCTFGIFRPLLLLPCDFVEQVSPAQFRAALAHELAHIHRNDHATHLAYRLLSIPVAFHPAVALTLARIVETREQICDGVAAHLTGGARAYAASLLELALLLAAPHHAPIPAPAHAIGVFDARSFERRILMLHRPLPIASRTRRALTLAAAGVVALATGVSALALYHPVHADVPGFGVSSTSESTNGQPPQVPSDVMAGQVEHRVQPTYPAIAKKAKIQGTVLLRAIIGKDGTVRSLTILSGPELLRNSSLDAVRQWTYKPYLLNGQPTEVETTITVNYSFEGEVPPPPPPSDGVSDAKPEGFLPPKLLSQVNPTYPAEARQAKISGEVIVDTRVGQDGRVSEVAALSGPAELRDAATGAVRQYVFAPATIKGQPVSVDLRVAVKFESF